MREALRRSGKAAASVPRQLPAPILGLNFRDPIASLKEGDALICDNFFPGTGSLRLRKGYAAFATGLPGQVETLMEYAGATRQYFAASGGGIYNITAGGAVGAPALAGLQGNHWYSTSFATGAGTFLVAVNGFDGVTTFDGTDWATQIITGTDAQAFRGVVAHKSRLWFWANGGTKAWYLGTQAIAGAATEFDFGPKLTRGGSIAFLASVSFDSAGTGLNVALVVVSTNGEMLIYQGQDPASAQTWSYTQTYRVGAPTGLRAHTQYGSDLVIMTESGLVSTKGLMEVGVEQANRVTASSKIDRVLIEQRNANANDYRWQLFVYPAGAMAFLNAPQAGNVETQQWVVNTITGAWGRFRAIPANHWCLFDGIAHFGGNGAVYRYGAASSDAGKAIVGEIKSGFSTFKTAAQKRFTMIRPVISANGDPRPVMSLDTDYGDVSPAALVAVPTTEATWDVSLWDASVWGGGSRVNQRWTVCGAIGVSAAFRYKSSTVGFDIELHAVDLIVEAGTVAAL